MLALTQPGNGGKIGFYFTDTEIIPVGVKGCFRFDKDDQKVHCSLILPTVFYSYFVGGQLLT